MNQTDETWVADCESALRAFMKMLDTRGYGHVRNQQNVITPNTVQDI